MLIEMIEKQIFLINLENIDIADVMLEQEDQDENYNEALEDSLYLQELLVHEKLELEKLNGSKAVVSYKDKVLSIELAENNTEYRLSILEFLDYPKYKKMTSYFLKPMHVTIKNVSEQIGGIIDKNYGLKFMITIEDK